ncbi:oxysterol-binding protein-related protein 6-like isoform X4 [Branchiostoma lanceolatum]|uniref:oxysterol-binding protein-related protein 6-like isoform X4 n=1 Tax=Branchiostoma lanceolatum TaxID=7740 RepID=UPI0034550527
MDTASKKSVEATRSTESAGAAAPPAEGPSAQDGTARLSLKSTSDKSTSGSSKETPSPKKEKDSPDLEKGEWEIVEGLKTGASVEKSTPTKYEGFMLKKRKWPLKGWHKRFFVLEKGFLKYAKRLQSVQRGKLHGSIDVGLSVMSIMKDARRIDLDTEDSIYHLKLKSHDLFNIWVSKLREHRLWRQNEIASGGSDTKYNSDVFSTPLSPETPPLIRNRRLSMPRTMSRSSSALGQGRVAAWLMESEAMEQCNKELSSVQTKVYQLNSILQELQRLQSSLDDQYKYLDLSVPDLASKKKSWRLSFRKSKHKKSMSHGGSSTASTSSTASVSSNRNSTGATIGAMLPPPSTLAVEKQPHHMSTPNISSELNGKLENETTPTSPTSQQRSEEMRLRQEFVNNAKEVYSQLKVLTLTLRSERDKLQDAMGQQVLSPAHGGHADRLGTALGQAQAQNADLRARLNRIAREADLTTVQTPGGTLDQKTPLLQRQFSGDDHLSLSTAESVTEFFDAEEFLISSSSSDGESEDESLVSGESEETMATDDSTTTAMEEAGMSQTGHRSQLPCPKPETGDLSIWSIMRKNIGKDLSKVCMPVTMNEPLNTLQRLAEELEYSELLDKAAETDNPYERMALIAAFAVSGYSSTYYRAGQKPFNPLLGETYECVREDKGFSFIAEQVSHHPPISACHCKGEKWVFWQDARLKTKFWGKSMEIIPIGTVNVSIPKYNDHYTWSKVTSCIHNIMTGQRWMDHYGEKIIKNKDITCRLMFHKYISTITWWAETFQPLKSAIVDHFFSDDPQSGRGVKLPASYWSTRCHDVLGSVLDKDGKEVHHLFGKWHEGLWCGHPPSAKCIWRPAANVRLTENKLLMRAMCSGTARSSRKGSMPEEYDLYYGFTRFAVELNELTPDLRTALPPTDTRFRPDQRLLEEGQVQRAQNEKVRLEQMQRMREREREEGGVVYQPRFFRRAKQEHHHDSWTFNNTYWDMRTTPGFSQTENMKLW